ncbi:MAG: nuclear transport factor 2 family protein [Caulobacterales bacterium]
MNPYGQRITAPGEDFRVADRLEIMDLVWRFATSLDLADREMFESCFADRVRWDLSNNPVRFTGGPADLAETEFPRSEFVGIAFASMTRSPSREYFVQHCVNNPLITFTAGEKATVLAHLRNPFHAKVEGVEGAVASDRMLGGLYHIDTQQVGDRWRMSALRLSVYSYDPKTMVGRS